MRASAAARPGVDDEHRSFVNVAVVRSALVTCGLRTPLSTNTDLQDFVRTVQMRTADPIFLFSCVRGCGSLVKMRTDVDSEFWNPQILWSALMQQLR